MSRSPLFVILEDYDDTYESDDEEYDNELSGDNFMDYISYQYLEHDYIDNELDRVKIKENDILEVKFKKYHDAISNNLFAEITIKKVDSKGEDSDNSYTDGDRIVINYYTYDEIIKLI